MNRRLAPPGSSGTYVGLFLVGLAARVLTGIPFLQPGYPDATYYTEVARSIAAGRGFEIGYVWNFVDVGGRIPDAGVLPIAANAHWMPLASIVQVPFVWALGPTWLAAVLPFWLLGALAVPITFGLGVDAGLGRRTSLLAALLVAMPGAATPFLAQPDNFSLYLVLGVTALWLCVRGVRGDRRAFALGGAAVGLAMLARTDGVLLGVPFLVVFLRERRQSWRARRGDRTGLPSPSVAGRQIGWTAALACFGLFVLVMSPWWIRDLSVFGSISPSSSNGRILWIRTYEQLFSASDVTTPATFFAQGAGPLLASRIGGLVVAVQVFAGTPLLFFLAPFAAIGWWLRRRDPAFLPWAVYAATFFVFAGVVFAVHLPYGMALHSEMALVPHAYLLSVIGISAAVGWAARRRPAWHAAAAARNFTVLAVAITWAFGVLATVRLTAEWRGDADMRSAILAADPIPAGDRLMSPDPGAFWWAGRIAGIVTPNDPLDVVEEAARRYGVRWLELERNHVVPSLEPVLAGRLRPAWLSPPLAQVWDAGADRHGSPSAALFAVCLEPGDARCATP